MQIPAAVRFVSIEPMLEAINLHLFGALPGAWTGGAYTMVYDRLHQFIVGCESGPKARPFDEAWACEIRDQCVETGTPYYYKQRPKRKGRGVVHMPKLDGRQWTQFPE